MDIQQIKKSNITIFVVDGRIDSTTSGILEKALSIAIEGGSKELLLDFQKMDYISSAGLRVLLMTAKKTGKLGGKTVLCTLNPNVKEVFDISGFSAIFNIYNTQDEAIRSF